MCYNKNRLVVNYMQKTNEKNIQILNKLKEHSLAKLNNDNEIIDLNSLYGMFIAGKNKFIFCKEDKFDGDDTFCLIEFFTKECVAINAVIFDNIIYPWRKSGRSFSGHFNDLIFYISLQELLGENYKNKDFTKKDLSYLYCIINEYLKENPNFINELFKNEKKKIR